MPKVSIWRICLLFQMLLNSWETAWADAATKQVQVEWIFPNNALLSELDPLPGMILDDRAAAIWSGHLCEDEHDDAIPWKNRFVEQALKSTTLPARAVEFLAFQLAKRQEFSTARTLVSQNLDRFPNDGRLAYLHALLDWNTYTSDADSGREPEPEPPLKPFAESLLGLLKLNNFSPEAKIARPEIVYEALYHGDSFTKEELVSLRILDDETRTTFLVRSGFSKDTPWMDFILPDSVETKEQMLVVWLGCLMKKMTQAEVDWLQGKLNDRGWKLPWQSLRAFRTEGKLAENWQRDQNPIWLLAAVHNRYCRSSNEPLLVPAFRHFENTRPALAVMAGQILAQAEKPTEEQLKIVSKSLELFQTLPEAPAAAATLLLGNLFRNEVGHKILNSPEFKKLRQHLADQLIRIGKQGRLDPFHAGNLTQLLALEGRWDDLFAQWDLWTRPSPFGSIYESKLAPWLTIDGAEPAWMERRSVTRQLPLAGIEPAGAAAETAYLEAAMRIPNPWFRLLALDYISAEARERAAEMLAAQNNHDYITCVTLAHWAKRSQEKIAWLKKALDLPHLLPAQLKTLYGRMYLAAKASKYEPGAPLLAQAELQTCLDYLQSADLDGKEADILSRASEYEKHSPKFWAHIHRVTPYYGHAPSGMSEEPEPTPEEIRAALREVLNLKQHSYFPKKLGEGMITKLQELSHQPQADHGRLAKALMILEDWPSALKQWTAAREQQPEDISVLHGAMTSALNINAQTFTELTQSLAHPLRRKVLGLMLLESFGLEVQKTFISVLDQELPSWSELTGAEAQAIANLYEHSRTPKRTAAFLKLTRHADTCYKAWMELNSASLPTKEKLTPAQNLEAARSVILLHSEAGLWNKTDILNDTTSNPGFYLLTESLKSGNPAMVEEICRQLEAQKSTNASFWQIRQRIAFGEQPAAFTALNDLGDLPCDWQRIVHETLVAVDIFQRRKLSTGNVSKLTDRLWRELKASPKAELGNALASLIPYAEERAILFRRFRDEAPDLLFPPLWLRKSSWYPDAREDGNSPLTQTYWATRWEAYCQLTRGFAADPQYTWLTLKAWRTVMDQSYFARVDFTGFLLGRNFPAFTPEFYITHPERAAEFLYQSPFFQDQYPSDLVPELSGSISDPFAAGSLQTCAGRVFLAMKQLTPTQRKMLENAYLKRAGIKEADWEKEYNWSLRKALLTGTSPVEAVENLNVESLSLPSEPDPLLPLDAHFYMNEWMAIFPNFEKDLKSNSKAKAHWDNLTQRFRKDSVDEDHQGKEAETNPK